MFHRCGLKAKVVSALECGSRARFYPEKTTVWRSKQRPAQQDCRYNGRKGIIQLLANPYRRIKNPIYCRRIRKIGRNIWRTGRSQPLFARTKVQVIGFGQSYRLLPLLIILSQFSGRMEQPKKSIKPAGFPATSFKAEALR